MSREVRHDGAGGFEVRFPFDRELVERIKTLPRRRWNAEGRFWSVPDTLAIELVELLRSHAFRFDAPTCKLYAARGGTTELAETAPALPFDPPVGSDAAPPPDGSPGALSVSQLNQRVADVLGQAFPAPIWLVGEISGFNRNAHKRHVGFQLVEAGADGKTISSVDATLFEGKRKSIEQSLQRAGDPFRLEDEVAVRLCVRVELYVPWGSYRVLVEEIDVNYTLGEAARRREEIVRQLGQEGLLERNRALPLPALPLRVGLITSLGSDAYNDVLRTLQESGYAFDVVAHGARVQGHATEPSVLNALDALRRRAADLDVVLICRGGGSRTDLAWFDSAALGRAVARFPRPIVVGIGHEQDRSVLDALARSAKTPTAAAGLLVERVRESLRELEAAARAIVELAGQGIREERRRGIERGRRLRLGSRALLDRERGELHHRRRRTVHGAARLVERSAETLRRWVRALPRATAVLLVGRRRDLTHARRTIVQSAARDLVAAGEQVAWSARTLGPRAGRLVLQEQDRLESRERRLTLVDPRRVLDRGYAILRGPEGRLLSDADAAPAGTELTAALRRGELALRSEGRRHEGRGSR